MSNVYALALPIFVSRHYALTPWLFRDRAEPRNIKVDAEARSGDYFITLATRLEAMAEDISTVSPASTSLALAKLADELTYVQKHYKIVQKSQPDHLTELG